MTGDWPTLPLRTAPVEGESIDSWIEALARRHRLSASQLLPAFGLSERARSVHRLIKVTPEETWRRMEHVAGLPSGTLLPAQLAGQSMGMTLVGGGTRFCPRCLGENGGRWLLVWRSNWAVACRRHRLLLLDNCPVCTKTPRAFLPGGVTVPPPGACSYQRLRYAPHCGTDLTSLPTTPAHPAVLAAQTWLDGLREAADRDDQDAAATLGNLPIVAYWLMTHEGVDWQGRAADLASGRAPTEVTVVNGRLPRMDAALIASVLDLSRTVLGPDDDAAVTAIRNLPTSRSTRTGTMPTGLSWYRWQAMTGPFPSRFLRAIDPDLAAMDRLRFKSPTPQAALPAGQAAADRGRFIPHLIWPDWAGRLLPVAGFHTDLFRATAATCLLGPGTSERTYRALTNRFNDRVTPAHLSVLLQGFGDLPAPTLLHVLTLFCRIATYLDTTDSPIDYQRRRVQVPTHPLITWPRWRDLALEIGSHPGDTPGKGRTSRGRLRHVQRHLLQLLTGADLGDGGHHLSFTSPGDRGNYMTFTTRMASPLRAALAGHAETILADLGIDEPVTWSPPAELADGLVLPGTDPASLDTDTIRRIVVDERRSVREAAQALGVNFEHVRFALDHLDRPERDWRPTALPRTWQRQQEMAQVATRDFFEREYVQGRRNLNDLAAETGYSRHLLAKAARTNGITLNKGKPHLVNDAVWLRDQYERQRKSTGVIAEELGISQMTVNLALHRFAIAPRPSGVHSSPQMINRLDGRLAADIRAAVEGSLQGWQRLHRFQIAMAFPTLKAAAAHLGIKPETLVVQFQRLEQDIGATLFHRATPATAQKPTERGRRLLNYLAKNHIRSLMAKSIPNDDLSKLPEHQAAAARQQFPRPRRPISPFTEIPVARLRITTALLDLLNDLMTHGDEQCYGALLITRLQRDASSTYEQLHRLRTAGWITSRIEDDDSWRSRASPIRGPGRRRTYYQLTPAGRDAAIYETARLAAHPPRRQGKR
ncbi:TniQ family protein [Kitasatospora sp. NPDC088779]|uniref:TniQ family protein n=1 Tax=Kitasatospora sp. NPDC088779 TaxID=3154964 RepID=UPI003428E842